MKSYYKQLYLIPLLALTGIPALHADQTEDLLKVMNQAMMEPCNSKSYMVCLGLKQKFCRKQVDTAVKFCNKKYPVKKAGHNKKQFFNIFGQCMQQEIIGRLKVNEAMLGKCQQVLQADLPKG